MSIGTNVACVLGTRSTSVALMERYILQDHHTVQGGWGRRGAAHGKDQGHSESFNVLSMRYRFKIHG